MHFGPEAFLQPHPSLHVGICAFTNLRHNPSPYSAHPTTFSAARNNPPAHSHPSASHLSTSPAPPAMACSRPTQASRSAASQQPCCRKLSSDAAAPNIRPPGKAPVEIGIAKSAPENTACKERFPARAPWRQDQNQPPCALPVAQFPNTSAASPTKPCCTPPA